MTDPNILMNAPVASVDVVAEGYEILGCLGCLPWHAEVVTWPDGTVVVREWHAIGCDILAIMLDPDGEG